MDHKDVLKLLFSIELGTTFEDDITLEGDQLDDAEASADTLLENVFADTAEALLSDWERVLGLTPAAGASIQSRQNACVAKLREHGGLSIPYFTQMALNNGYTITISEFRPFMTGIGRMGDRLYEAGIIFCWQVTVHAATDPAIGKSELEALFQDLKPADTFVYFYWPVFYRFRRMCMADYPYINLCDANTWDSRIRVDPIQVV